jgi:hypothetical protein
MVEYENVFYHNLIQKLGRIEKKIPIHVNIITRDNTIYIVSLDDGFSASFVYMAYLKAKKRRLDAKLLYARFIDESWLPEEIRKLGEKWIYKKLGKREIETLRKIFITEHIFDKWCK